MNRKAAQDRADQSNAGCPLCGHSEPLWLKSKAAHRKAAQSVATEATARQGAAKQRGRGIHKCRSRVVLAQVHSMTPQRLAFRRTALHRIAMHSNAAQRKAAQFKATRPVCSTADCPSRFGSRARQRIASHGTTAHRSPSIGKATHGKSKQRGQFIR